MKSAARRAATDALKESVARLRRSRLFHEFDRIRHSLALRQAVRAEFAPADSPVRASALAWCARLLANYRPADAADCLREAREVAPAPGAVPEIWIAAAVLRAKRSEVDGALQELDSLRSPLALTAVLTILRNHRGNDAAISWWSSSGHSPDDLDSEGRCVLLWVLLAVEPNEERWREVRRLREGLTPADFAAAPLLHYAVGVTLVMEVVPNDLREVVRDGVPLNASTFPLASTPDAMRRLREAVERFGETVRAARELNVAFDGRVAEDYSLWLRLRDPETNHEAADELAQAVVPIAKNLRLVPMGIQYGVALDLAAVETVAAGRLAAGDEADALEAATALFALAGTKPPLDGARFLTEKAELLSGPLDRDLVVATRIELLILGEDYDAARGLLKDISDSGGAADEKRRLEAVLRSSETEDLSALVARSEETKATRDLERVVLEMDLAGDWDGVSKYGKRLFEVAPSVANGERLANGLIHAGRDDELDSFLEDNREMVESSAVLQRIRCWRLFDLGRVLECRRALGGMADDADPNLRNLRFNLAVVTGDWDAIPRFVAEEYAHKSKREVRELVELSRQSAHFDLPYTKELVREIAQRGEGDADALAAAYWLAAAAGLDREVGVSQWLRQAIALSDDDGPLQRVPIGEVVEQTRKWNRRSREISEALRHGDIPTCVASQALNMPLLEMTLRCAIENRKMGDRRGRGVVPAYSGVRGLAEVRDAEVIGLGPTALLTLSVLDSLEEALDGMPQVVIPHGTLAWLFVEKQNIRSHQPSRVVEARRAMELAEDGVLKTVVGVSGGSGPSKEVSEDLGALLAEIGRVRDRSPARLVVSNPVRTWDGDGMRTVDFGEFQGSLVSPFTLVRAMRAEGELTDREAQSVMECLGSEGQRWPQEPEIARGDALYLDQLAVGAFMQPRLLSQELLRRLGAMGYPLYVSEYTVLWYRGLLRYEGVSEELRRQVDALCDALRSRIESGQVRLAKRWRPPDAESARAQHPELDLVRVAEECDGIMTDDRFLNRYRTIGDSGREVPVWTTWDWIRTGRSEVDGSARTNGELATTLRRCGYLLAPVTGEELRRVVGTARVMGAVVEETPEMTAIRRSVELVRDSRCLEMPREMPWLRTLVAGCAGSIRSMWLDSPEERAAIARAEWIGDLLRAEEWKLLALAGSNAVVDELVGRYVELLLQRPGLAPEEKWRSYCRWVARRVAPGGAARVGQQGLGASAGMGGAEVRP